MDYKELQDRLRELGVSISISTLLRYRRVGLLPEAKKSHGGRGQGPIIDFPPETLSEVYATWKLFSGEPRPTTETVKKARQIALEALEHRDVLSLIPQSHKIFGFPEDKRGKYAFLEGCSPYIQALAVDWLISREIIRQGFLPKQHVYIIFLDTVTVIPLTGNFELDESRVNEYRKKGAFTYIRKP